MTSENSDATSLGGGASQMIAPRHQVWRR